MRGFPFSFPHNDILNNSPIINMFTYGFLILLVFFFHCNLSETDIIYISAPWDPNHIAHT